MRLKPFERVITEHGDVVLRVLRGVVGPLDADDCWQETFIAALRAYPTLRPDSNVRGWLVTIAHHKAIDLIRGRARHGVASLVDVAQVADAVSPPQQRHVADVADEVAGVVDGAILWAAVGALPEKQRLAVAYRYGADLSYADVATLLACTEAAARRSAFEGIRTLRTSPDMTVDVLNDAGGRS